jgi:hypothetical protein
LALAVNDQEESECDEEEADMLVRKFKKFCRNSRYANQRNNIERGSANTKTNYECHKCGSMITLSRIALNGKNEKGKRKQDNNR